MKIKLTKIGLSPDPLYPTALSDSYKAGQDNGPVSVPVDYWVIGTLVSPIQVGKSVLIDREIRNGIEVEGFMTTSTVQKLTENGFETYNSRYKVEYLEA